jgi:hypothetical protein
VDYVGLLKVQTPDDVGLDSDSAQLSDMIHNGERQKVGGPVLTTVGRTPRRATRRMNRLIFRPPTFWHSPKNLRT